MPELPEVETIKDELSLWVSKQRFVEIKILDADIVSGTSTEEFCRKLTGKVLDRLERRGKYLIFNIEGGQSLVMHFRMTGIALLNPDKTDRHIRANFHFSNGVQLAFIDRRRLGLMWLVDDVNKIVGRLGPEPLARSFNPGVLSRALNRHRIPIKAALLDQSIIAGVGNMYADEALFAAKIHPLRRADALSVKEIRSLCRSIQETLSSAIGSKGASVDTYVRPGGQLGRAHFKFNVAHMGGKPCNLCGTLIQRTLVRNRGSYFCPNCQPLRCSSSYKAILHQI